MQTLVTLGGLIASLLLSPWSVVCAQSASPPLPLGLWANVEEGMVLRITPCGDGFCGAAAGALPNRSRPPRAGACGARILSDFRWNASAGRWEGRMQPPGRDNGLSGSITTDGAQRLRLQVRMLLLRKTMVFEPFKGVVDSACTVS